MRSFIDRIDLVKIVNQLLPTQMAVEPGLIVKGLIIDTLSGRSPLYHLESSFEHCDRELLFGEDVPACYFNDDNVARTLDQLYRIGTHKIFSALAVSAVQAFGIEAHHAHYDTTSVNVYGEYAGGHEANTDGLVRITYGHSKDKRPDLKQFLLSTLCVGGNVPILGSVEEGNASDKTLNRGILNQVSSRKQAKELAKPIYACRTDADAAAKAAGRKKTSFHGLEVSVEEHLQYARGRPKKGMPRQLIARRYPLILRVVENIEAIEIGQQVTGCFVMLTNIPIDGEKGYDSAKILRTYKDQQGVERNFSFLKDDQIVNALFLKRHDRIEVLGLILLIALLIWRLMEHQMRDHLQHHEFTVPGWDNKPTQRPMAYMLMIKFKGILILRVGYQRTLARPLSETQSVFLKVLELPSTVFIQPPESR